MNVDALRSAYEAAHKKAMEARTAIDAADAATITDDELAMLEETLDAAIVEVERTKKNYESRVAQDKILADATPEPSEKRYPDARGTLRVEGVYRRDTGGYFQDIVHANNGDQTARERLIANNKQAADVQKRAISQTATAGGEFIPPVWLNEFAPKLRAGRAAADAIGSKPLPPQTNSINLPRITTGSTAAVQSDGGAVSNTDVVTAALTAQIQTVAGRTIASYQLMDLSQPAIDEVVYTDSLMAYNQSVDVGVLNGAVTNAKGLIQVTGVNAVTYTDATPTLPEFYPTFFQGKSQIEINAFDSPHFALIHPSVWNSFLGDVDSSNRPLMLSVDAARFNAAGAFEYSPQGLVGNLAGIPVVADANIPTTTGRPCILVNRRGFDLWESTPVFKVADQTNIANLQYQFVLYGYYAVMSRQPAMISVISGTGLVPRAGF